MQTLVAPTLQQRHPTVSEGGGLRHASFKVALAKLEVLLLEVTFLSCSILGLR